MFVRTMINSSFLTRYFAALSQTTLEYLQFAALSKLFAACVTYPYQVVRARLQDHHVEYSGSVDVIRRVLRYEGVRGLYKGLTPYLCHVTPNICCVFLVYELMANRAAS